MTSSAIRAQLARLGLSQTGAARLLGVNPRTVRNWCSEPQRGEVPPPVERLLWVLEYVPDALRLFRDRPNHGE